MPVLRTVRISLLPKQNEKLTERLVLTPTHFWQAAREDVPNRAATANINIAAASPKIRQTMSIVLLRVTLSHIKNKTVKILRLADL